MSLETETLQWRLTMFYGSGRYFADYFLQHASNHHDDWPWLEADYANLLAAARHC